MATTAATPNAADQSSRSAQTVDTSLWWEPFSALLTELENASVSSELPESLEKKLKANHGWFLHTTTRFKSPNMKSREALNSPRIKIGDHEFNVETEFKEIALKISSMVCLDEVQSYVLVKRSLENGSTTDDDLHQNIFNLVILEYYVERQCLLKCTRLILMHALYYGSQPGGSVALEAAHKLISDGLESSMLSIFQDLLSSNYPDKMDADLYILWAEEMLTEDNLILDIIFLVYYECFCTCDAKAWKKLCAFYEGIISGSYNFQKLTISPEAIRAIYHAKVQLLLILIESLNLEILLQMIHDNIPFRQGSVGFSEMDVQQMDAAISIIDVFQVKEAGPLILAWAVFLCLISSLPEKESNNLLMDIDHIGYVRQAFEASSLGYFHEILQNDTLKYSDGPVAGYRSVLRTFISAFIASYEIALQPEDDNLKLILDILCKIYQGEESLCIQFWDRDSFIDGPVRCLLCNLEGEFPFRTVELLSLLSALCEGSWPSECVFNFLDKSIGLSTLFEITDDSVVDPILKIVETRFPLHVAGVEGLLIPARSRGQLLRMINNDCALVRWEYTESGVLVLLLRLAQELYRQNSEDLLSILDLLSRLVTFNMGVCYSIIDIGNSFGDEEITNGNQEKYLSVRVVEIICALLKSFLPNLNGVRMMALGVNILTKMMGCLPSHVALIAMKGNIFDVAFRMNPLDTGSNNLSSGSWLLSGRLAKMLLIDCEQSDCMMTLSVLDFTMNLLDTGLETDPVLALIVFCLQYVLVNHEFWKYRVKSGRWKVTLKVLQVVKKCISTNSYCRNLGESIHDILLTDPSIHSALFRIVCTTTPSLEKLFVSRLFDLMDIEGLQLAISSGLDVLASMMSTFSKDSSSLSVFHQAMLSPTTKPIPVISAAISLLSYFRNAAVQLGAAKLLSVLFAVDFSESYNVCLGLDDNQIVNFRRTLCGILAQQSNWTEDIVTATWKFLTLSAQNQPGFLTALIMSEDYMSVQADSKHLPNKIENGSIDSRDKSLPYEILQYLKVSEGLFNSKPNIVLCLLNFLRALWQGAPQFTKILEQLKASDNFWRFLTSPVVLISSSKGSIPKNLTEKDLQKRVYNYQFLSSALDILGYEIFLQKKLMHSELIIKQTSKSPSNGIEKTRDFKLKNVESFSSLKEIISTWCKGSLLSDLIKACVSWEYDNSSLLHTKIAAGLFAVNAMVKLRNGDSCSLSVALIEKIVMLSQKLCKLPAFSELLTQYRERSYSGGSELENLILSDLFYLIQGELEGRPIENKPYKELLQFFLESDFLNVYKCQQYDDLSANMNRIYLYDTVCLRADLGMEMWDLLTWKESKEVAETMLLYLQDANAKMLYTSAKLSALRGLTTLLHMHENNLADAEASTGVKISDQVVSSCIDHVCQCIHTTIELLASVLDADKNLLNFLTAQAELLLILVRSSSKNFSPAVCVLILKTSGYGLKVLRGCRRSTSSGAATKLFLMSILGVMELIPIDLNAEIGRAVNSIECSLEEATNSSLGLLPVLCDCIEYPDHCTLSLSAIDLILKGFSTPDTWFPIIQRHLPLQHIILTLQDTSLSETVPVILKFLLNIAHVRQGADMLLNAGILSSLKVLLSEVSDGGSFYVNQSEKIFCSVSDKTEKSQPIWGLSLAILTAIIQSLGDSLSAASVADYVMACILVERVALVSYYLASPDFPIDVHESKRARPLKSNITLRQLEETQNTLALICVLTRHWNSWKKVLQGTESPLREKCIHLLAFISRATQHPGESPKRVAPLLCHPVIKEELELYKKPSFINSRNGWFALSALGCKLNPKFAPLSSRSTALVFRDQSSGSACSSPPSHLSDMIAVELYRIAFLLLKFLCLQADNAARKAEELGFIDLAHFPELPMPEILHGLQDQGIAIVTELCEAHRAKQLASPTQEVCLLLLQITVMALHLEFCVIPICGMRPIIGRVESFSRDLKLLIRASEGHAFIKEPLKNLKQILSFVHPELLQQEALF